MIEPIVKLKPQAYPINGDDHGYEGDIVILHENGSYRIDHSNWIGNGECRSPGSDVKELAYESHLELGYTHWLPLDIFFKGL